MSASELLRSPAVEDYCKAIFVLQSRTEDPVSTNAIAERLAITPGPSRRCCASWASWTDHACPLPGSRAHRGRPQGRLGGDQAPPPAGAVPCGDAADAVGRVHAEAEVLEHVISEELEQLISRQARGSHARSPRRSDPFPASALERETRPLTACKPAEWAYSYASRMQIRRCCAISLTRHLARRSFRGASSASPSGGRCS